MKIIKLESFTKPFVSFVRVTLEDGSNGFGQMSTYHADITAKIFHKQLAPWVLGKHWENFENIEKLSVGANMVSRSPLKVQTPLRNILEQS